MASLARANASFFAGASGGSRALRARASVASAARPATLRVVAQGNGRFIVGGNWKCNGTKASVEALVAGLNAGDLADNVDVVVAPPFLYMDQAMATAALFPGVDIGGAAPA